jgi:hypothetical protein
MMPPIVDDVVEVIAITTIPPLPVVLSYPPTRVIVTRCLLPLADNAASLQAHFARLLDWFPPEGSP